LYPSLTEGRFNGACFPESHLFQVPFSEIPFDTLCSPPQAKPNSEGIYPSGDAQTARSSPPLITFDLFELFVSNVTPCQPSPPRPNRDFFLFPGKPSLLFGTDLFLSKSCSGWGESFHPPSCIPFPHPPFYF